MINPRFTLSHSQDLEPTYHDAGQFYWFDWEQGLNEKNKGDAIVVSEIEVQDIDTWEEWRIDEYKFNNLNERQNRKQANCFQT